MLTIIIPVYNEKKYLRSILNRVIKLKKIKIQIILVDDGSTDGSAQILRSEFSKVKKLIESSTIKRIQEKVQQLNLLKNLLKENM